MDFSLGHKVGSASNPDQVALTKSQSFLRNILYFGVVTVHFYGDKSRPAFSRQRIVREQYCGNPKSIKCVLCFLCRIFPPALGPNTYKVA